MLPPARRGIAMVFQSYALYPHLDVAGNWALGLKQAGETPAADRGAHQGGRAHPGAWRACSSASRRSCRAGSGSGSRSAGRSCAIPRCSCSTSRLSNLDAALRSQVRFEIARLHKQLGATMVYVTHDQVEAMTLADRIVVMDKGIVQQVGTPEELYRHAGQPVRRRLHRLAQDELPQGRVGRRRRSSASTGGASLAIGDRAAAGEPGRARPRRPPRRLRGDRARRRLAARPDRAQRVSRPRDPTCISISRTAARPWSRFRPTSHLPAGRDRRPQRSSRGPRTCSPPPTERRLAA